MLCSRPAVSMRTTSASISAACRTGVERDGRRVGARRGRSERCARRPARPRSVTGPRRPRGRCLRRRARRLGPRRPARGRACPTVVVLPVPLTPTTRITAGRVALARRDPAVHGRVDQLEQVLAQPAAHGRLVADALDGDPAAAVTRRAPPSPRRRGPRRAGCPRRPPRCPRRDRRGTAARAALGRGRCWSGPGVRGAAADGRGRRRADPAARSGVEWPGFLDEGRRLPGGGRRRAPPERSPPPAVAGAARGPCGPRHDRAEARPGPRPIRAPAMRTSTTRTNQRFPRDPRGHPVDRGAGRGSREH